MTLRTPEISSMLKETDDDVEFATDMEEPVCEGSEEHNHQQERHPHGKCDLNLNVTIFHSNCAEGLHFSAFH